MSGSTTQVHYHLNNQSSHAMNCHNIGFGRGMMAGMMASMGGAMAFGMMGNMMGNPGFGFGFGGYPRFF